MWQVPLLLTGKPVFFISYIQPVGTKPTTCTPVLGLQRGVRALELQQGLRVQGYGDPPVQPMESTSSLGPAIRSQTCTAGRWRYGRHARCTGVAAEETMRPAVWAWQHCSVHSMEPAQPLHAAQLTRGFAAKIVLLCRFTADTVCRSATMQAQVHKGMLP